MPWHPLRERLDQLPLILAGPILRRTEPHTVTVWVALRERCEVKLQVFSTHQGQGTSIHQTVFEGVRTTVRVGQALHIVAVTARSPNDTLLDPNHIYAYDLDILRLSQSWPVTEHERPSSPRCTLRDALKDALGSSASLSYFSHGLPTFVLPPDDLNHLRIAHGSCRKAQGEGWDSLPILDDLIQAHAQQPTTRLHQLFLTGDQIYGDDVADPLLLALADASTTLLGWEEPLPIAESSTGTTYAPSECLKPGHRSGVADEYGGLTAGLRKQAERAKSHLFRFGEYCATYLFFWSNTLWPEQFPEGREVWGRSQYAKRWDGEVHELRMFAHTLEKVRRLLANVPTYMIFDDHDVTDDWYLNQAWCLRVLGKPLGRRTVQNGLLAYALFQAWGNTPEQFQVGQVGESLWTAVEQWSGSKAMDPVAGDAIARYLGLPAQDPLTGLPKLHRDGDVLILDRDEQALTWHYTIRGACHEVIVLDTRTWRGYPLGERATAKAPPMLLSPTAFKRQIRGPLKQTDEQRQAGQSHIEATLIIAPTNLVSLKIIDRIQHWNLRQHQVYNNDVGDAWNIHKAAFAELLSALFERRNQIVVLSGDIHYGSVVRLDHWVHQGEASSGAFAGSSSNVLVQLTASAFCNAETKTRIVHTKLKSLLPERSRYWLGWNNPLMTEEVSKQRAIAAGRHFVSADWSYRIQWIRRQSAQTPTWGHHLAWMQPEVYRQPQTWRDRLIDGLAWLWRNRWVQDGKEVVGLNNVGVVRFEGASLTSEREVLQELYWYPPWKLDSIVFSRYSTLLRPSQSIAKE